MILARHGTSRDVRRGSHGEPDDDQPTRVTVCASVDSMSRRSKLMVRAYASSAAFVYSGIRLAIATEQPRVLRNRTLLRSQRSLTLAQRRSIRFVVAISADAALGNLIDQRIGSAIVRKKRTILWALRKDVADGASRGKPPYDAT